MRLNSIRTRTLIVLILIGMAIVFILGGLWTYTISQNIRQNIIITDLHDTDMMASYVHEYVESVKTSVVFVSGEQDVILAVRERNIPHLKMVSDELANTTPHDNIAYITDKNGQLIYSTAAGGFMPLTMNIELDKNASYITGIYYSDEFKDYVFAITAPIKDNGTIVGYISDEVRPNDLYNYLNKERTGPVDHIVLVDGSGKVIFDENRSILEKHPDISSFLPVKNAVSGEEGYMETTDIISGVPGISAYAPINDTSWGVILSTDSNRAYHPLESHLLRLLGLLLLFILVMLLLGYFASAYLIVPIERLSRTMKKVSSGDYDVSIAVTRNDEIGDMERAFNALMAEIKKRDDSIKAEKERSELYLDIMSHDINNMNQVGIGFLEMTLERLKGHIDHSDEANIEKAHEALKYSSELIDNVRKIQKVKRGGLESEIIDLGRMLAEVKKKYSQYPGRDIAINYTPVQGCFILACGLFKEVFANIVGNAIKHTDPGKPLAIGISLTGISVDGRPYYQVAIEDNGPGIPDEMKKAIFARFQRGGTPAGGRGLGLYIVKMLVEEFGGKVWVEDRVPGDPTKGARFVVLMPAAR